MKNTDDFHFLMQKKPSCATTKSTHFNVRKDKWNTKEDMKNALCVLQYANQRQKILKIKLVVLAVIELCLSEGISQSVRRKILYKNLILL